MSIELPDPESYAPSVVAQWLAVEALVTALLDTDQASRASLGEEVLTRHAVRVLAEHLGPSAWQALLPPVLDARRQIVVDRLVELRNPSQSIAGQAEALEPDMFGEGPDDVGSLA